MARVVWQWGLLTGLLLSLRLLVPQCYVACSAAWARNCRVGAEDIDGLVGRQGAGSLILSARHRPCVRIIHCPFHLRANCLQHVGAAAKLRLAPQPCTAVVNADCLVTRRACAAAGTKTPSGTWCASRPSTCVAATPT